MEQHERSLAMLEGWEPGTRIEVVQVALPGEVPALEFRLQRESASLGWMTERRIRAAAGQVPELRMALNLMDPDAQVARPAPAEILAFPGATRRAS